MRSLSQGYVVAEMAFNRDAILPQTRGDYLI
jgi:hypothetical protein